MDLQLFPSRFGGEYVFNPIKVDPFTFEPRLARLELTPLRAFAHRCRAITCKISYPNALVDCAPTAAFCQPPAGLEQFLKSDISVFAHNFRTPKVNQASLGLEREVAEGVAVGISYTFVHGQNLIRARDVNLPPPVDVSYPVYDSSGVNLLGYDNVQSFSTWQMIASISCPFPPCINPISRPIPQLGAITVFGSAASIVYNGVTVSIHRQMSRGVYFRMAYTYAHALDDGQDALVAGQPATVQNAYAPQAERGTSVTDQRQRFVFSWITEPRLFDNNHSAFNQIFDSWKYAGVVTVGSGRPVNVMVSGDANQDDNNENDRLPGARRNSFLGPDYASTDLRITRVLIARERFKLEFVAESFNLLNRNNKRVAITDQGLQSDTVQFLESIQKIGFRYYPAQYRAPSNPVRITNPYAPRHVQFGLKLGF